MKRYDMVDDDKWITEVSDGDYILFTDHEAAIKQAVETEREECAALALTSVVDGWRNGNGNYCRAGVFGVGILGNYKK